MKRITKINKNIVNQLKVELKDNLISIVLFGSYPRGTATKNSDIDIMIVVKRKVKSNKLKDLKFDILFKFEKNIDFLIFNKKDIKDNMKACSPIFSTLVLGNNILYDKNKFFKKQFKTFVKQLNKTNIKYCEGGKIWELKKMVKCLEILH